MFEGISCSNCINGRVRPNPYENNYYLNDFFMVPVVIQERLLIYVYGIIVLSLFKSLVYVNLSGQRNKNFY